MVMALVVVSFETMGQKKSLLISTKIVTNALSAEMTAATGVALHRQKRITLVPMSISDIANALINDPEVAAEMGPESQCCAKGMFAVSSIRGR